MTEFKPDATPKLAATPNPLLQTERLRGIDVETLTSPTVFVRKRIRGDRNLRDIRRRENAEQAIAGLAKDNEIFGLTKGQFSLLDLISAIIKTTGPARITLSTWTANRHEIIALQRMRDAGEILTFRWLVDFSFARRDPEAAHQIRQTFGLDAIRVAQTHAKFCLFENAEWKVVLCSSMNLNMNVRLESFELRNDTELFAFFDTILNEIWDRQPRSLANGTSKEMRRFFIDQM